MPEKVVGVLTCHSIGDYDIVFVDGSQLGRLPIGEEFEALVNGRWKKTSIECIKHPESPIWDYYYLRNLGDIPFCLEVRKSP
jgi:hypothetical protein